MIKESKTNTTRPSIKLNYFRSDCIVVADRRCVCVSRFSLKNIYLRYWVISSFYILVLKTVKSIECNRTEIMFRKNTRIKSLVFNDLNMAHICIPSLSFLAKNIQFNLV